MKIHMLKTENHAEAGRLNKGTEHDIPEPWASYWCANGSAEPRYETKVVRDAPIERPTRKAQKKVVKS